MGTGWPPHSLYVRPDGGSPCQLLDQNEVILLLHREIDVAGFVFWFVLAGGSRVGWVYESLIGGWQSAMLSGETQ